MSLPLSFVSWNCRGGLSFNRKEHFIRNMVSTNNLSFIGLLESKKEVVGEFLVSKLWPNLDYKFDFIPSVGASGGILLIWNSMMNNVSTSKGHRCIVLDFLFDAVPCRHILIYASNVASERMVFWRDIQAFLCFPGTILISGDFNETLSPEDRLHGAGFTPSMVAFRDFVNNAKLFDLPLQGRSFTWQNSHSRSRIDRCLISAAASSAWPNMSLLALPRGQSDHVPICFRSANKIDWGPKPFRSIDAWWDHNDFEEFVKASWGEICLNSSNLIQRLKEFRRRIKGWNSDVFGEQSQKIKPLQKRFRSRRLLGSQARPRLLRNKSCVNSKRNCGQRRRD
ncbi:uncharacterized protein LOC126672737 [Mercurialis annua]|uniref:uncharacterized protein LOC126672737 n=1 Tax=Mercurialis annua TaxID=3986 RepID=UPI00215F6239|nr:uncharacterized protein LOC126672737 [Mercurialis annua]